MSAVRKRTLRALAGALVAAALVVAPLVTAGASAGEPVLKGEVGVLQPWSSDTNKTSYWEKLYAAHKAVCYKSEGNTSHGKITDGGKTVTLKPFDPDWPGDHWELLVIKGGDVSNNVIEHPKAGVAYASPLNKAGKQSDVSHWIVCKGTTPETPPATVIPALDWDPATCDTAGVLRKNGDVIWTSVTNNDGTTTWTAAPKTGTVFPPDARVTWTVPDLAQLAADSDECRPDQPEPEVSSTPREVKNCASTSVTVETTTVTTPYVWNGTAWVLGTSSETVETTNRPMTAAEKKDCPLPETPPTTTEWADGEWACGDTTVTQTREVTTTTYAYDDEGTAVPTVTKNTETQPRPLTEAEIDENCPLAPGDIDSVCVGDVPYLGYAVTLPEGFEADSETPVTITFVNPDGEDYVVENQPLSGELLWPGASATAPKMWPGWELVNGEYVQTDGNFAWTRAGVTVRFEVNPSYSTEVQYPEASAECANPPVGGGTPASTDTEALAVTGGGVSPIVVAAGGAALFAGIAVVAIAAYRRRHASMQ
ncbi:hypothetical protein MRBLMI12_002656 [Microbacterium sp. LMI12-1-1.1]|uniref:hypothetical protein n=1 Tax=Microbacterium sp. LMI12-1-1.1 TaxID=3135225 RepID=UPI003419A231